MASFMGSEESRTVTVRPVLERVMSPASSSTLRCFITAGSLIANGLASSLTAALSWRAARCYSFGWKLGTRAGGILILSVP